MMIIDLIILNPKDQLGIADPPSPLGSRAISLQVF